MTVDTIGKSSRTDKIIESWNILMKKSQKKHAKMIISSLLVQIWSFPGRADNSKKTGVDEAVKTKSTNNEVQSPIRGKAQRYTND